MHADVTRVRQVLFNLLSNAAKFTTRGVVSLRVLREYIGDRPWVVFTVRDSGIGMQPEEISRLFQPFSQADASTSRKYGGTGLGLAISRRLCSLMGGEITVTSVVTQGSEFVVRLPAGATEPAAPITKGDRPTVLVIDDDPACRELMSRILGGEGFHVATAAGGEQGLQLARLLHPAVITLDVLMPRMDGWAALGELKGDPAVADIPVVLVTMLDNREMGYALGAADFLMKPVDRVRLVTVLERQLSRPKGETILLVEDDPTARDLIARHIEQAGWRVFEAANGRDALAALDRIRPALILLDLLMPEMDGFDFLTELHQQPRWRSIPIVVITSKDLTADDHQRLRGRVEKILLKGAYQREDLLAEIRAAVAHGQRTH